MFDAIERAWIMETAVDLGPSYRKGWPNAYAILGKPHPAHPNITREKHQTIALAVHVAIREHWGV